MREGFIKSLAWMWLITALAVAEGYHLQNSCPGYVSYYCACSLADIAEEKQLKMCQYEDLGKTVCHPCPEHLQKDVNCASCDDDTCPICSLHSFGAGKGRGPHTKQEVFLKFSRDHGILFIHPWLHYPRYHGSHQENVESHVLHETNDISNQAVMPNISFSGLQESFKNKAERKESVPVNTENSGTQQQKFIRFREKVFNEPFKIVQNAESTDDKNFKKFSLNNFEEAKNDKHFEMQFQKEKFEKIFIPSFTLPKIDEGHSNLDDAKLFEPYYEELKYDNQLNHMRKNMKENSFHPLPSKEKKHIAYEKLINNQQINYVKNFENDYIIPLHVLHGEANILQNITSKLETHTGDKCSFVSVPGDSDMDNNTTTRTVNFQCSFTKEFSKLSFRDYLLDLNDINATVQKCISDINPFNFQEKIHLIKTNCNVSLPLTILFKYIQLAAANKTESRNMQFAETVTIQSGNFTNKIEFIVKLANLSRQRKKSAAYYKKALNNINGILKIEIRLHLKKTSGKKITNGVNDVGSFFADTPLHGLAPKLKMYQTGDTKFKFSKDGLKVKIYFTDFPGFKIEVSVYELLNYFSNRSKKLLTQSRIFITVDGIDDAKNEPNFPQSVAQKNDWIDNLLLKSWFGNSTLNISDSNRKKYNKIPVRQGRKQVFPKTTKQNIFNIVFNERGVLENGLKHDDSSNDSADETERKSVTNLIGQVFLHNLLNLFVDDTEKTDWFDNFIDYIEDNTEINIHNDKLTQHDLLDVVNKSKVLDDEFKSKRWRQNRMEEEYTKMKQIFSDSDWMDDVLQIMYGNRKLNFSDYETKKNDGYVKMLDREYNESGFPGEKVSHLHEYRIGSANGNIYKHEISEEKGHNKQKSMDKGNENLFENLKHETNKLFFKPIENLTLFIMNVSDNAPGFSPKVPDFSNLEPNITLKRVYRDIPQVPLWPSEKDQKKFDKIVMTHRSVMKFLNLSRTPGDQSQNFSNALLFQYRKYALIPKINETLQQKKLKKSDIFEMLNASVSTLKKSKIYNSKCETCSVIYKIMLDSGFQNDPKLMENENSSVVVVMSDPQFTFHPNKPKFHASSKNKFKKAGGNTDFAIQMSVNLLFLSANDYQTLSRENGPKSNILLKNSWKDINKNIAFKIPENFISESKILKLRRLLRHRNLKPAFTDLVNQGQFIEELQKILFALLSKMHDHNTKTNMEETNRSMILPLFSSEKTKFEKIKESVTASEGNGEGEKHNVSQNFEEQDPHENHDKFSISTYNSDKGKKVEKFWHKEKTGIHDGYTKHKITEDGTLSSSGRTGEKTSSKAADYVMQSYQSDVKNMKHHFEVSKSGTSDFENVNSNKKPYHFTITESLQKASRSSGRVNLNKNDDEDISEKNRKLIIQPVNDESETDETKEKSLLTENQPKKSQQPSGLNSNNNTTGKANDLEKTVVTIDQLVHSKKESENYDTLPQFKNDKLKKNISKTKIIKAWNKNDKEEPKVTLVEKAGEFKESDSAVVLDHGRKSEEKRNFNNTEIADREILPTKNKNIEASRLENRFPSEQETTRTSIKLVTTMHHIPETLENETKKFDPKISEKLSPEKDHETIKETTYIHKDTLNTTTSEFGKNFHKNQDDANFSLNGIRRVKRSLHNSNDASEDASGSLFGGVFHFRLNESENLHHRSKRYVVNPLQGIPHNWWCPIMSMRRNGIVDCTFWSFKKICTLTCHPGFSYMGKQAIEVICLRKGGRWNIEINLPCTPNKGSPALLAYPPPEYFPDEPPHFRSGELQSEAQPLSRGTKLPHNPAGKKTGVLAKSNDKKDAPPKESKSPNGVAENGEDDDYYENYDYTEK